MVRYNYNFSVFVICYYSLGVMMMKDAIFGRIIIIRRIMNVLALFQNFYNFYLTRNDKCNELCVVL